ncbi:uncharacterized protein LOC131288894 [Anopheles ziemanni]|uniref:uncharacterized protein LOC131288894 n=1 Tax=Anopheles ziemanni TaxID=345580 RepID=UPI00265E1C28|nr:uncharacterized protein LOC131288894 [Anopheles ziemanni]
MEAAANNSINLAKDEVLTASISSEDSDSWTLLGKNADQLDKEPSGVEIVKTERGGIVTEYAERKQRHDSHQSNDSQLDESSDGISIISETDTTCCEKLLLTDDLNDECVIGSVHFKEKISLKPANYEPPTPPFTPEEVKLHEEAKVIENLLQVQSTSNEDSLETIESVVGHRQLVTVNFSSWIIFSVLATGMAAIILGNAMRLQNRVDEINFEHEKRISELELENNILKNEMNKLRHLYTRSELDEQVQRAEFEWLETFNQQHAEEPAEIDQPEAPAAQQPTIRKVPPQDSGVKRKIVWSGDEEEPMLIVDKDYILPAFCYNRDQAVQDDLFFEYSAKYCDVRKRKIEAKQKKAEFEAKRQPKKENYNKFIEQVPTESVEDRASFDPSRLVSPFNIDYKKALDAIKSEGSVIVEAFGNIFDLSPDPEEMFKSKLVDTSIPIEEAPPLRENQIQNEPDGQTSDQRVEQENSEENFHKNGKKVHQSDWEVDDSHHKKNRKESQFLRQKSEKFQMNSQKHSRSEGANNGDINYEREDAHHKLHFDARYKQYDV